MNTGKTTDYLLNDDKAKKQLLSSAKRTSLKVTNRTKKTTKFAVCVGTNKEVIYPVLDEWSCLDLKNGGAMLNSPLRMDVHLKELRHDNDSSFKRTQSVADIVFKNHTIKIHFYHTNQTVLIHGENHDEFYFQFFTPLLAELSQLKADKIRRFNTLVITSMKPGPRRPEPVRPVFPRDGRTRATAGPVSSAVSSAVSILEEILEMSGIPNTSQDISVASPEMPALGNEQLVEPSLATQPPRGQKEQNTSTPNPSPPSSPARRSVILKLELTP